MVEKLKGLQQLLFDGHTLVGTAEGEMLELTVNDWSEIGAELSQEQVWLVINHRVHNLRIPCGAPVFKDLLDCFASLEEFDWEPLVHPKVDAGYVCCWRRRARSSRHSQLQTDIG